MLTKSTDCQSLRKPARQGGKLAAKGAYTDVSDRRLQVQLTQEAKIVSEFSFFKAFFAFAGFVSALRPFQVLTAARHPGRGASVACRLPDLPAGGMEWDYLKKNPAVMSR